MIEVLCKTVAENSALLKVLVKEEGGTRGIEEKFPLNTINDLVILENGIDDSNENTYVFFSTFLSILYLTKLFNR